MTAQGGKIGALAAGRLDSFISDDADFPLLLMYMKNDEQSVLQCE